MTTRPRLRSEQRFAAFARRQAHQVYLATLGNNAGVVEHPTRGAGWVYARLHGDPNQVIAAHNAAKIAAEAGVVVAVELAPRRFGAFYEVLGLAAKLYADNAWSESVGVHAAQHQRRDLAEGGFDALDVYVRALVGLRARAQVPAALTVHVETGFYEDDAGTVKYWAGGDSGVFAIPPGTPIAVGRRCDLLYLDADDALQILEGTLTDDGSVPARPTVPANAVPLVYAYLDSEMTTLGEDRLLDARVLWRAAVARAHDLLSARHSDTVAAAVVAGDIVIGNATPKWARLALSVPAANVRNVLGVDNGDTLPSYKAALDATLPASITPGSAGAAGTSLVFAHRDHAHPATSIHSLESAICHGDQVVCHADEILWL